MYAPTCWRVTAPHATRAAQTAALQHTTFNTAPRTACLAAYAVVFSAMNQDGANGDTGWCRIDSGSWCFHPLFYLIGAKRKATGQQKITATNMAWHDGACARGG